MPVDGVPERGLRERKKARTRAAIQQEALRLFRRHGVTATTMEQIARAADVSVSTVFRYFPTKDDLLALGGYRSLAGAIARAFADQPAERTALEALRGAVRSAHDALPPDERQARRERDTAILQVPELWTANLPVLDDALRFLDGLVASRSGRAPDDPAVRALTGAVLGVGVRALLEGAADPDREPVDALDAALAALDTGMAL